MVIPEVTNTFLKSEIILETTRSHGKDELSFCCFLFVADQSECRAPERSFAR